MASPAAAGTSPASDRRRSHVLHALAALAAASELARLPDGTHLLGAWPIIVLQAPLPIAWILLRCGPYARPDGSRWNDRWLTLAAFGGGAAIALLNAEPALFTLTTTIFITGILLLGACEWVYRSMEARIEAPSALLRYVLRPWLMIVLGATILLASPIATHSAVPDYRHNFWSHVLSSALDAVSAGCLVGTTVYSFAEDYNGVGQLVLVLTCQLSGIAFCAVGLSIIRPFLKRRIRLRTVLICAFALQFAAVAMMWPGWQPPTSSSEAAHLWENPALGRVWWGVVSAGSAIWNCGLTFTEGAPTPANSGRAVFRCLTTLSIVGSLGIPILIDLLWPKRGPTEGRASDENRPHTASPHQKLPQWEATATFLLLLLGAVLLFYFETPGALPDTFVPIRPFDLGDNRIALRDNMSDAERWTSAVFVSATLRSAGMESIPVSQGALSWPSGGVLLVWTFLGGSAGGMGGGARVSSLLLLAFCLVFGKTAWRRTTSGEAVRRLILSRIPLFLLCWVGANFLAACAILATMQGTVYDRAFEGLAAVNGVALSAGLVPHLTPGARIAMIVLLIVGRFGPMVFWTSLANRIRQCTESTKHN